MYSGPARGREPGRARIIIYGHELIQICPVHGRMRSIAKECQCEVPSDANARSPMLVTLAGIVNSVRELQ